LGENRNTAKRNTEALLAGSKEVGLDVNTENTDYMVMSPKQNVGQNHNLLIAKKSFKVWQSSSTCEQ
jgi:hypothetical protein